MPTKKAPAAPVFDISQLREQKRYVTRVIDREDAEPLTVKLEDLSIRQTNDIPWGMKVALKDSMEAAAKHVVEWDLQAENVETGELVSVPSPAEAGWEVFELLENKAASDIINWLKIPHYMKAEEEKKSSTASTTTSEKPSAEN